MAKSKSAGSARSTGGIDALEEFESLADRGAQWVGEHAQIVLAGIALVLLGAAAYGGYGSWRASRADAASSAVDDVRSDYLRAMGADLGALEVPELANPEAARSIREEYVERFATVAQEHAGTAPAAVAWLEVGDLKRQLDDEAGALGVWENALGELPASSGLRGLLNERIAALHEDAGRWTEAAQAHEAAGAVTEFPLRYASLAAAARCYAAAGDDTAALVLLERLEVEAPTYGVPEEIQPLLLELRAAAAAQP